MQIPALVLLLMPDDGTVSLDIPVELSVGTLQMHVSHMQGQARFDGRVLRVTDIAFVADEASVTVGGVFEILTRVPERDLRLSGVGDITGLVCWGLTDADSAGGASGRGVGAWLWLSWTLSGEVSATTAVNAPRPMGDAPRGLRLPAVSLL